MGFKLGSLGVDKKKFAFEPAKPEPATPDPNIFLLVDRSAGMGEIPKGSAFRAIDLLKRELFRMLDQIKFNSPSRVFLCRCEKSQQPKEDQLNSDSVGKLHDIDFDNLIQPFGDLREFLEKKTLSDGDLVLFFTAEMNVNQDHLVAGYNGVQTKVSPKAQGTGGPKVKIFALSPHVTLSPGVKENLVCLNGSTNISQAIVKEIETWNQTFISKRRKLPYFSDGTGQGVVLPLVEAEPHHISYIRSAIRKAVGFHEQLCALKYRAVPTFIVDGDVMDDLPFLFTKKSLSVDPEKKKDKLEDTGKVKEFPSFSRLELLGEYLHKGLEPNWYLKKLFEASGVNWPYPTETGIVLICLERFKEEAERWVANKRRDDYLNPYDEEQIEYSLIETVVIHEHCHAISQEGIDTTLDEPYRTYIKWEWGDNLHKFHSVSEALAEWATLDSVRHDRELYDLVLTHAKNSPRPYQQALNLEKMYSAGDYSYYRNLMTAFRRDLKQAYKLLKSWKPKT